MLSYGTTIFPRCTPEHQRTRDCLAKSLLKHWQPCHSRLLPEVGGGRLRCRPQDSLQDCTCLLKEAYHTYILRHHDDESLGGRVVLDQCRSSLMIDAGPEYDKSLRLSFSGQTLSLGLVGELVSTPSTYLVIDRAGNCECEASSTTS